jgi:hypothetical protein
MKYTGAGVGGLLVGAAIGVGGAEETKTVTSKPPPAKTVVSTKTVAPDAETLAELRSRVSDERDKLAAAREKTSDERSKLRELQGAVKTAKANTVPGTGTFVVGEDIEPGTYRAAAQPGCYWARLNSLDTSDIADNDNADGPVVVEILPSDKAFQARDCGLPQERLAEVAPCDMDQPAPHNDRAVYHAQVAEQLLDRIKPKKALGRGMDVQDGNTASVATAHATLALFHQREAEKA